MTDVLIRQIEMLRSLPREPRRVTTPMIRAHLESLGYVVTLRTIQRDLIALSAHFPLVSDERDHAHGWAWKKDAAEGFMGMDSITALSFVMATQLLDKALPPSVLDHLRHLRTEAERVLSRQQGGTFMQWPDKVRVLPPGQPLLPAIVLPTVLDAVYDSLLRGKRLACQYENRKGEINDLLVSPLGVVLRQNVVYLIATINKYQDIRQMALHRFKQAELTDEAVSIPPNFSLNQYLADGEMGFKESDIAIALQLRVKRSAGLHLFETPLSYDQKIIDDQDGCLKISATVPDTRELRTWILGFGEHLEVIAPSSLRDEVSEVISAMAAKYNSNECVI